MRSRVNNFNEKIEEKYPKVHKSAAYIADVWRETFPNEKGNVSSRMERRKAIAQKQAKYTEEEMEAMQEEIPEWKRGGMVVSEE